MLNDPYRPGVVSEPWGPLISPDYTEDEFTNLDVLVASIPWALTLVNVILALWQIYHQTKLAKTPIRSPYLWMAWLELGACFALGLVGYLHVLKHIPASEYHPCPRKHCADSLQALLSTLESVSCIYRIDPSTTVLMLHSGLLELPGHASFPDYRQSHQSY